MQSTVSSEAAPIADNKLLISGLHKSYGNTVALAPTDLQVKEGEFVTLLGPSGSGKTTLLMMVAGLLSADGGQLWLDGKVATFAPPWERGIGVVFQNYALFPHLTVYENIAFPLRMRRFSDGDIRRKVARVLDIVQLPDLAGRYPRALSGGQQQRIALARCFVFRPSLILMDEPLGALDKKLRDQLQLEIKHLHRKLGTTILYVTHDQQETMMMSDRVCLMNGGRVEQVGTPQDIYFRPATLFAADFLGESNLFEAVVRSRSDGRAELSVETADMLLRASDLSVRAGQQVTVMVRPERVVMSRAPNGDSNAMAGVLRESIFVGGITRHYVDVEGVGTVFGVELTTRESKAFEVGESIFATWRIEDTVLIPTSGGTLHP